MELKPVFIGTDWSITSPAWTIMNNNIVTHYYFYSSNNDIPQSFNISNHYFNGIHYPDYYNTNLQRYSSLAKLYLDTILPYKKRNTELHVVFENYSYMSKGKVFNIAESTAIAKYLLYINDIEVNTVTPAQWKKAVGLKGNSIKDDVIQLYAQETGIDLCSVFNDYKKKKGVISDIADSYFIMKYIMKYAAIPNKS